LSLRVPADGPVAEYLLDSNSLLQYAEMAGFCAFICQLLASQRM
jgi:hypothetical protein